MNQNRQSLDAEAVLDLTWQVLSSHVDFLDRSGLLKLQWHRLVVVIGKHGVKRRLVEPALVRLDLRIGLFGRS